MNEEKTTEGVVTTDTSTQETNTNPQPQADKTFTQDEVNRIVSDRLKEDRQKREQAPKPDPLAEREAELTKREFAFSAREVLAQKKLPAELLDALNAPDMDTLNKSIALLEQHLHTNSPNKLLDMPPCGNVDIPNDLPIRQAMRECVESERLAFKRVVSGSSLEDLDLLLALLDEVAKED